METLCRVILKDRSSEAKYSTRVLNFTKDRPVVTVGRASINGTKDLGSSQHNAYIDSAIMSRNHAEIIYKSNKVVVEPTSSSVDPFDLPSGSLPAPRLGIKDVSRNGTRLNGEVLEQSKEYALKEGDDLQFGSTVNVNGQLLYPECFTVEGIAYRYPSNDAARYPSTFSVPEDDEEVLGWSSDEDGDEDGDEGEGEDADVDMEQRDEEVGRNLDRQAFDREQQRLSYNLMMQEMENQKAREPDIPDSPKSMSHQFYSGATSFKPLPLPATIPGLKDAGVILNSTSDSPARAQSTDTKISSQEETKINGHIHQEDQPHQDASKAHSPHEPDQSKHSKFAAEQSLVLKLDTNIIDAPFEEEEEDDVPYEDSEQSDDSEEEDDDDDEYEDENEDEDVEKGQYKMETKEAKEDGPEEYSSRSPEDFLKKLEATRLSLLRDPNPTKENLTAATLGYHVPAPCSYPSTQLYSAPGQPFHNLISPKSQGLSGKQLQERRLEYLERFKHTDPTFSQLIPIMRSWHRLLEARPISIASTSCRLLLALKEIDSEMERLYSNAPLYFNPFLNDRLHFCFPELKLLVERGGRNEPVVLDSQAQNLNNVLPPNPTASPWNGAQIDLTDEPPRGNFRSPGGPSIIDQKTGVSSAPNSTQPPATSAPRKRKAEDDLKDSDDSRKEISTSVKISKPDEGESYPDAQPRELPVVHLESQSLEPQSSTVTSTLPTTKVAASMPAPASTQPSFSSRKRLKTAVKTTAQAMTYAAVGAVGLFAALVATCPAD